MRRIKCLFGFHDEIWIEIHGKYNLSVCMECKCCKKKGVWLPHVNAEFWVKDLDELPEFVKSYLSGDFLKG